MHAKKCTYHAFISEYTDHPFTSAHMHMCTQCLKIHRSGFISLYPVSAGPSTLKNSSVPLIAPYLMNLNLSAPNWGNVSYLLTNQTSLLMQFTSQVKQAFAGFELYSPSFLLIATWDEVGCHCSNSTDALVRTGLHVANLFVRV